MKKYIGVVKIINEGMYGVSYVYKAKFSDDLDYLYLWFEMYKNSEHIILENDIEKENFYKSLEDLTAVTETEEEQNMKIYKKFMKND